MKESTMYKKIKRQTDKTYIDLNRIETGGLSIGIPDIYYYCCHEQSFHGWIELKTVSSFKPFKIKIDWRKGQLHKCNEIFLSNEYILLCVADDKYVTFIKPPFLNIYFSEKLDLIDWRKLSHENLFKILHTI